MPLTTLCSREPSVQFAEYCTTLAAYCSINRAALLFSCNGSASVCLQNMFLLLWVPKYRTFPQESCVVHHTVRSAAALARDSEVRRWILVDRQIARNQKCLCSRLKPNTEASYASRANSTFLFCKLAYHYRVSRADVLAYWKCE